VGLQSAAAMRGRARRTAAIAEMNFMADVGLMTSGCLGWGILQSMQSSSFIPDGSVYGFFDLLITMTASSKLLPLIGSGDLKLKTRNTFAMRGVEPI